jgi:hypothetical protein
MLYVLACSSLISAVMSSLNAKFPTLVFFTDPILRPLAHALFPLPYPSKGPNRDTSSLSLTNNFLLFRNPKSSCNNPQFPSAPIWLCSCGWSPYSSSLCSKLPTASIGACNEDHDLSISSPYRMAFRSQLQTPKIERHATKEDKTKFSSFGGRNQTLQCLISRPKSNLSPSATADAGEKTTDNCRD